MSFWGRSPLRDKDKRKGRLKPRGIDPFRLLRRKWSTFQIMRGLKPHSGGCGKTMIATYFFMFCLDQYDLRRVRMQKSFRKAKSRITKLEAKGE